MNIKECCLECFLYNILMFFESFLDFIVYSWIRRCDLVFRCFIKNLTKGVELWLFNYTKQEVLYDNKGN
jgi:hypothetical protein